MSPKTLSRRLALRAWRRFCSHRWQCPVPPAILTAQAARLKATRFPVHRYGTKAPTAGFAAGARTGEDWPPRSAPRSPARDIWHRRDDPRQSGHCVLRWSWHALKRGEGQLTGMALLVDTGSSGRSVRTSSWCVMPPLSTIGWAQSTSRCPASTGQSRPNLAWPRWRTSREYRRRPVWRQPAWIPASRCASSSPAGSGTACSCGPAGGGPEADEHVVSRPNIPSSICPSFRQARTSRLPAHGDRGELHRKADPDRQHRIFGRKPKRACSACSITRCPRRVMPMRLQRQYRRRRQSAIFFGLSGTGKTTRWPTPAAPRLVTMSMAGRIRRCSISRGGCYAKMINPRPRASRNLRHDQDVRHDPRQTWPSTPTARALISPTPARQRNTWAAPTDRIHPEYFGGKPGPPPLEHHFPPPADALGVLPPIARLTPGPGDVPLPLGYTAKVAGTEMAWPNRRRPSAPALAPPSCRATPASMATWKSASPRAERSAGWWTPAGRAGGRPIRGIKRMPIKRDAGPPQCRARQQPQRGRIRRDPSGLRSAGGGAGWNRLLDLARGAWSDAAEYDRPRANWSANSSRTLPSSPIHVDEGLPSAPAAAWADNLQRFDFSLLHRAGICAWTLGESQMSPLWYLLLGQAGEPRHCQHRAAGGARSSHRPAGGGRFGRRAQWAWRYGWHRGQASGYWCRHAQFGGRRALAGTRGWAISSRSPNRTRNWSRAFWARWPVVRWRRPWRATGRLAGAFKK